MNFKKIFKLGDYDEKTEDFVIIVLSTHSNSLYSYNDNNKLYIINNKDKSI